MTPEAFLASSCRNVWERFGLFLMSEKHFRNKCAESNQLMWNVSLQRSEVTGWICQSVHECVHVKSEQRFCCLQFCSHSTVFHHKTITSFSFEPKQTAASEVALSIGGGASRSRTEDRPETDGEEWRQRLGRERRGVGVGVNLERFRIS